MRIAWFTPLSERSAIGQVGVSICEELASSVQVDLWAYEKEDLIGTRLPVKHYDPEKLDVAQLSKYDHVIYNLGNNGTFHLAIFRAMKQFPGIVILHDQTMERFFAQSYIEYGMDGNGVDGKSAYEQCMLRNYGSMGYENAVRIGQMPYDQLVEHICTFSLLNEIFPYATAVFTHAEFFADILRTQCMLPVSWAYLPFSPEAVPEPLDIYAKFGLDPEKPILLSCGLVQGSKRIDWITDVLLANKDLANSIQYVVIGNNTGPYGDSLRALADGPLHGSLFLLGYQPYEVMNAFLENATACINLRYPNSEVGSLSLFEQMGYENAVVVLDSGVYGEVPKDSVLCISFQKHEKDLENALRLMLTNPERVHQIGRNAASFIRENCNVQMYISRLFDFLAEVQAQSARTRMLQGFLGDASRMISDIGLDRDLLPEETNDVFSAFGHVLCNVDTPQKPQPVDARTIGLWFGFAYAVPGLSRESSTRFLAHLTRSLLHKYDDLQFEIWAYSFNEDELRISFGELLENPSFAHRIRMVTEANFPQVLEIPRLYHHLAWNVTPILENLAEISRSFSHADIFIPVVPYLDNVLDTEKKVFVPVHDLATCHQYAHYVQHDNSLVFHTRDSHDKLSRMVRRGATLFCGSNTLKLEQILSCMPFCDEKSMQTVILPELIPVYDDSSLSADVLQTHGIQSPYLFYPTQLQPHKNIDILFKAVHRLKKRFPEIQLVLTDDPAQVENLSALVDELALQEHIVVVSNVSEQDLMSLYRFAAAVPVTTVMEGYFPTQASEALAVKTPVVLSDIPVVQERIAFCGWQEKDPGLLLFDAYDDKALAKKLTIALTQRKEVMQKQSLFQKSFFSYSWQDAAQFYHKLFFAYA